MAPRKRIAIVCGIAAASLICLPFLAHRNGYSPQPAPRPATSGQRFTETERLRKVAIADLEETRIEVAKMKAFGIGMPVTAHATRSASRVNARSGIPASAKADAPYIRQFQAAEADRVNDDAFTVSR